MSVAVRPVTRVGRSRKRGLVPALLAVVLAACSGPILANAPAERPSAAPPTPVPAAPPIRSRSSCPATTARTTA